MVLTSFPSHVSYHLALLVPHPILFIKFMIMLLVHRNGECRTVMSICCWLTFQCKTFHRSPVHFHILHPNLVFQVISGPQGVSVFHMFYALDMRNVSMVLKVHPGLTEIKYCKRNETYYANLKCTKCLKIFDSMMKKDIKE